MSMSGSSGDGPLPGATATVFPLGIFLGAVGAMLAFAVHATVAGLDILVAGWVLAASALGPVLTVIVFAPP